ncbi:hypothetical protein JX265_012153 [Neoarthrinium moseri]|uniref:ASST-domain-containing protein n=1 Tax=Neoarthrinium moseri TaxID=1658444 RepID=A0A9Q0AJY2_9PEZI|nr:hypothetical protein JX266_010628 [Neoarthrinium moseri]KAI1855708.1 hypothetical protein JX265_012153 [Neoarthrinium moseri]
MKSLGVLALVLTAAIAKAQSTTIVSIWPYQTFVTEPNLRPPIAALNKTGDTAPGHIIFAQSGRVGAEQAGIITTENGQLLWNSDPTLPKMSTLTPFVLDGKKVLAYWTGISLDSRGDDYGTVTIIDDSYQFLYNITLADPDLQLYGVYPSLLNSHEVYITDHGTFVGLSYDAIPWDLSPVGGPTEGWLRDGVVYEIDIKTNNVLFKWRASEHIQITRSRDPGHSQRSGFGNSSDSAWDYVHLNSVSSFEDGYIISARHTFDAIYVSKSTGNVIWRLQGEDGGDFSLSPGAAFRWQHDIRLERSRGELLLHLHDNENNYTAPYNATTGKLIKLDTEAMTAEEVQIFAPSYERLQASSGGSYQPLRNDNVLIYFGSQPVIKEFRRDGVEIYSYRFGPSDAPTNPGVGAYRAFKSEWKGYPITSPKVSACRNSNGTVNVFMSWNGATETKSWNIYSGSSQSNLKHKAATVKKVDFETFATIPEASFVQVEAIGGCSIHNETRLSDVVAVSESC